MWQINMTLETETDLIEVGSRHMRAPAINPIAGPALARDRPRALPAKLEWPRQGGVRKWLEW
jgi:hypothetical protein